MRAVCAPAATGSFAGSISIVQWQWGARSFGHARRAMDRADARARVRGVGGGVEGRIFDVVTHADDARLAVGLDVEQRAAVAQPELAAGRALELPADVHVLVREADVELERLHDRVDPVSLDAHQTPHASGVDGARAHPLVDGEVVHRARILRRDRDVGHQRTVEEVPEVHGLEGDREQGRPGQLVEGEGHAASLYDLHCSSYVNCRPRGGKGLCLGREATREPPGRRGGPPRSRHGTCSFGQRGGRRRMASAATKGDPKQRLLERRRALVRRVGRIETDVRHQEDAARG